MNAGSLEEHKLYNGKVKIYYDDDRHRYTKGKPNGPVIQGVSSALDSIAKPLHFWTVKMALNYVREQLTAGRELTVYELEDILEGARKSHLREKGGAADRGRSVHKYAELTVKGVDFPEPDEPAILDKLNAFRQLIAEQRPDFIDTERVVYSKKYDYVGKLDCTMVLHGKKYVGDIKTGTAVRETYWAQTAAYQQALQEETKEQYDGRVIILLSTDKDTGIASYSLHFRDNEHFKEDFTAFMCGKFLSKWLDHTQDANEDLITIENLLGI